MKFEVWDTLGKAWASDNLIFYLDDEGELYQNCDLDFGSCLVRANKGCPGRYKIVFFKNQEEARERTPPT